MRLATLQAWLQAVVVHQGTTTQALRSPTASRYLKPSKLGSVLSPSPTLTAAQRVAIYQKMYPLRMRDALASDYPGLEHFLGDGFPDFVGNYIQTHPSTGYTLNRLGDHVADFIGGKTRLKHRGFLQDLARLEFAITQAFDSPEAGRLQAQGLEAVPPARLGKGQFVTVPSLRLVRLSWNAADYLDTIKDEEHRHPRAEQSLAFIVIVRRDYSVFRFAVSEAAFAVLRDIDSGMTIGEVIARALRRRGRRRAQPGDFAPWLQAWTADGVFQSVRLPSVRTRPKRRQD